MPLLMAPQNRLKSLGKGVEAWECQTLLGALDHD